jgi:hypothetical protein
MPVTDPYRDLARADLVTRIENGTPIDWFNRTNYPEIGDRTPTEAWQAGDHEALERLIDQWYAEAEAHTERRLNDPKFSAIIESRREALAAKRSTEASKRNSA